MGEAKKRVVAVGMSGGVDSTIAALILKQQGFKVIGLTMKIWDESLDCGIRRSGCFGPGEESNIAEIKRITGLMGIEHHVIDLKKDFREKVLDYFRGEYKKGRTPNPCVECNSKIKFGRLIDYALSGGIAFDFFATGHYARIEYSSDLKRYILKSGIDKKKDQSYFLYRLNQDQLEKTVFPLGRHIKEEIRHMALMAGLKDLLERPESQDFSNWDDYTIILGHSVAGDIVDIEGKVIGRHRGIEGYTIGQRKGLNLAGMKEPYYVIEINPEKNEVTAGPKPLLMKNGLIASDLNWIITPEYIKGMDIKARIRYRSKPAECDIEKVDDHSVRVLFKSPQEAITPGQSVVFYSDDTVLGGGIIKKSFSTP